MTLATIYTEPAAGAGCGNVGASCGFPSGGRVAPGLPADLVLVNGNPAEDIKTRNIVGIWKAGVAVDRRAWLQRVKAASGHVATQIDRTSE